MNAKSWCTAVLVVSSGCAALQPAEKASWSEATGQPATITRPKFDAQEFAAKGLRPKPCEDEAKQIAQDSMDDGWAALKICAQNPTFTLLNRLLEEPWATQLATRPDALPVLARLLAQRGGSIERDLAPLNGKRVPLFSFAAAMTQPDTYKGRYVLIRAKITESKTGGGAHTIRLAEMGKQSSDFEREVGPSYKSTSKYAASGSNESSGRAQGSYNTTKFGSGSGQVNYNTRSNSNYSSSGSSKSGLVETRFDNVTSPTGREALGRLSKPDPFLNSEKEYVILARFDGTRVAAGGEEGDEKVTVGVLTVVTYAEPIEMVLE